MKLSGLSVPRASFLLLMICAATFTLSGCALFSESEQKQPASARTARSCMKNLRRQMDILPDYFITACTSTGVWVVEQRDPATGDKIAEFDFLNKLYGGIETGGGLLPLESLGWEVESNFTATRKKINSTLLEEFDKAHS